MKIHIHTFGMVFVALILTSCVGGRIASVNSKCGAVTGSTLAYNECVDNYFDGTKYDMTHDERQVSGNKEVKETDTLVLELQTQLDAIVADVDDKALTDKEGLVKSKSIVANYIQREIVRDRQAAAVSAAFLGGSALAIAAARGDGGYGGGGYYSTPLMCSACSYCTIVCTTGKACGDTCIEATDTCHVGAGTACNTNFRVYP